MSEIIVPSKRIVALDSQILNTIQLCARKVKLSLVDNYGPSMKPSYLETGGLMHTCLEAYYTMLRDGASWKDAVQFGIIAGKKYSISFSISTEEIDTVLYQFTEYTEFYRTEGWIPLDIERPFSAILYDSPTLQIIWEGRIDLTIKIQGYGEKVFWVDHKTQKRNQELSPLANQFMGYCWFTGTYSGIVNKIGFQKTLAREDRFKRPMVNYSKVRIEEWETNTLIWVGYLLDYIDSGIWPANFTSCDKYAGCVFQEVCTKDPDMRQYTLDKKYLIHEPWNPAGELK